MKINPYNNVYFLTKSKPKYFTLFIAVLYFIILFISLIFIKFSKNYEMTGIYSCEEDKCILETFLPIDEITNLKNDMQIIIDNQEYHLQIKEFNQIEKLITNNITIQYIDLEIPKLDFYQYQTITFHLKKETTSFWQLFYQILKGGDNT